MQNKQNFKQKLFRLHNSAGIIFSLLMYISVFFGIFAILLPYIQTWEKPSRHFSIANHMKINYNKMVEEVLSNQTFPKNNIIITLPGVMKDPALKISHKFETPVLFNPITEKKIDFEGKQSHLASFLNEMHYGKPFDLKDPSDGKILMFFGRILFGLIAVAIMLISISGLLLTIHMKFKNNKKTPRNTFSKYHIKIFTYTFPIFIIITLGGAFMNIGLITSSPMAKLISGGKSVNIDAVVGSVLFPIDKPVEKENISSKMKSIAELLIIAKKIAPDIQFQQIKLINWKDKSAQVQFIGYNPYRPFLNGVFFIKPKVILNAIDGTLIEYQKVLDRSGGALIAESILFLHFLFGVDLIIRLFVICIMIASAFAISFGVMLFLEKKARKFDRKIPFYHWMEKVSLTVIIGVIPSTGLLFALQWVLPFDLQDRVLWQQGIFFNAWLFTLLWSFYRINTYQAAKELLSIGGFLFMSSPLLHHAYLEISPIFLIKNEMINILSIDVSLLIFGILLIYFSTKLPNNRDEIKYYWIKKGKNND